MGGSIVSRRTSTGLLVLMVFGLVLAMTGTAMAATSWKKVTPSAKFVKYAAHAKKHGMQAWYPSRLPSGYKLSSMKLGDTGSSGPYCDIVFKKSSKRIYVSQGTIVGADGEMPEPSGQLAWGTQRADVFSSGLIFWMGANNGFANLWGKGTTAAQRQTVAKYMKKVR